MSVTLLDAEDTVVTPREQVLLGLQDKCAVGFTCEGLFLKLRSRGQWCSKICDDVFAQPQCLRDTWITKLMRGSSTKGRRKEAEQLSLRAE